MELSIQPKCVSVNINNLPYEMLLEIFKWLEVKDVITVASVSKLWRNLSSDFELWRDFCKDRCLAKRAYETWFRCFKQQFLYEEKEKVARLNGVTSFKKGMYVSHANEIKQIKQLSKSRTGKHGYAKFHVVLEQVIGNSPATKPNSIILPAARHVQLKNEIFDIPRPTSIELALIDYDERCDLYCVLNLNNEDFSWISLPAAKPGVKEQLLANFKQMETTNSTCVNLKVAEFQTFSLLTSSEIVSV